MGATAVTPSRNETMRGGAKKSMQIKNGTDERQIN
jgi:hypothetical protein